MNRAAATATSLASGDRRGTRREVVAALSITTTIGYGVLYYAFSALLAPMSHDLQISTTVATGALTTAVLVSAAMAIPVGRRLDAYGGHGVMTIGSILATLAVLAWSQVQNTAQLYAVFVAIGAASAMVLYQPAFAIIVAVTAPAKRANALLSITLVAGFASSIFIPLTGQLIEAAGWRQALIALAGIVAVITVPVHAFVLGRTQPTAPRISHHLRRSPARVIRDLGFWLIAAAFVLHSAALAVLAVHLVTYLTQLGHTPTTAAGLTGLLGLLSVTGRVITTVAKRWLPITLIAATIIALQGVAIALLPFIGQSIAGAATSLGLFGLGFGVASIATPAILLDRYGDQGYATIAGILGTPTTISRATAPLAAAALATTIGYRPLILAAGAACVIAGAALALTQHLPPEAT
ncbi:putative MFS family arabinose efflux permease [Kribbella voronezhensis]|uniref:Putative MFS family arabinose efflux permease n=1 Tax=Kribbella voronezhensis TaxID=2512212 RepID=A0A4R7TG81_9ACTN|nr:MFS transporter [Kribbella voronezhensis]TDU90606.1 putative MFS family arabinose efflux permease [Kribbella voronezhensis]